MQGIWFAVLGTGFTFAATALGAAFVFLFRKGVDARAERICLGFASGVMSAAAVFSLLLPAIEAVRARGGMPAAQAALGFGAGAGLMLAADAWLARCPCGSGEETRRRTLMITAVTLHNIPEGMAVGLAFVSAAQSGGAALGAAAALAFGIGVQNLPEGAAVSLQLYQGGMGRGKSFALGAASGMVEPAFGVAAALAAAFAAPALPFLMAGAAGAMMAVVFAEMIPAAARDRWGTASVVGGYMLMMALDVALG